MRPDRTGTNGFPSRHTSWAFAASTILSNELYRHSPFWSLGAQAASSAVGMQRVFSRRHYASDVISGAAIGIVSTEIGYLIARKVFGRKNAFASSGVGNDYSLNLAVTTEAIYWFGRMYGLKTCTGFASGLRLSVPVKDKDGISVSALVASTPVHTSKEGVQPVNMLNIATGWERFVSCCWSPLSFEPGIGLNLTYLSCTTGLEHHDWAFGAYARMDMSWRLTQSFAVRLGVNTRMILLDKPVWAVGVAVSSVACF